MIGDIGKLASMRVGLDELKAALNADFSAAAPSYKSWSSQSSARRYISSEIAVGVIVFGVCGTP